MFGSVMRCHRDGMGNVVRTALSKKLNCGGMLHAFQKGIQRAWVPKIFKQEPLVPAAGDLKYPVGPVS